MLWRKGLRGGGEGSELGACLHAQEQWLAIYGAMQKLFSFHNRCGISLVLCFCIGFLNFLFGSS